jgi:hypothetical protein
MDDLRMRASIGELCKQAGGAPGKPMIGTGAREGI